jgi:hypothetical protein
MCSNDNSEANHYEERLFSSSPEIYGDKYKEHYMELYKLYVNTAEAVGERRQKSNSFFLTLNTTIIAVISYVQLNIQPGKSSDLYWLISLSGMVLSYTWYRTIKSYKDINVGKFKIIHLIERKLPLALYDAEWDALGRGKKTELYLEFTTIEKIVPWIFFGIHTVVLIRVFPWKSTYLFIFN